MKPSNRTLSMMSPKVRQSIMAVSVVTALSLHAGEYVRIGDQWQASPQYQEYLTLQKAGKMDEAKELQNNAITRLTDKGIEKYILGLSKERRDRFSKDIMELPIGLKGLLVDIDSTITSRLKATYTQKEIDKIKHFEFDFVDSIYKGGVIAERSINKIAETAPELDKTEIIAYL